MRETTKTITFDFTFKYTRGGVFDEANCITVCEPSFEKRAVHRKMSSIVMEAQSAAQKKAAADPDKATITVEVDEDSPKEVKLPDDFDLMVIRMGLDAEAYGRFCEYMQKELSDCKALAYVGSDPEDRYPINDGVWRSLAQEGGMEAVDKVLSAFASFFSLITPRSPTTNGSTPSLSSEAKATVSSPTRKPRHSPTQP